MCVDTPQDASTRGVLGADGRLFRQLSARPTIGQQGTSDKPGTHNSSPLDGFSTFSISVLSTQQRRSRPSASPRRRSITSPSLVTELASPFLPLAGSSPLKESKTLTSQHDLSTEVQHQERLGLAKPENFGYKKRQEFDVGSQWPPQIPRSLNPSTSGKTWLPKRPDFLCS